MTLAVHHVAVIVVDLERAEHFYCEVLGLQVLRRWQDAAGAPRSLWLQLGAGAFLAVERVADPEARRTDEAPGLHCLALGIERAQRDHWRDELRAAGYPVERESAFTLYVRDPEGNLIGLSHYPEAVAQPS